MEALVARKQTNEKEEQLKAAEAWCRANGKPGYAALKTGQFPLIKDRETINKRLDGKLLTGEERLYCKVLTSQEENMIVQCVKNKNRCICRQLTKRSLKNDTWRPSSVRLHQHKIIVCKLADYLELKGVERPVGWL